MSLNKDIVKKVFNEWQENYHKDPESFESISIKSSDYPKGASEYFIELYNKHNK